MIEDSVMDTSNIDQTPTESFNVNRFRVANESDQQWNCRKQFIEAFRFDYNEERLLCLAQCYANTKCLGCKYSEPLKTLLDELAEKLANNSTNKRSTSQEPMDTTNKRNAVPPIANSTTSNVPLNSVFSSTSNFVSFSSATSQTPAPPLMNKPNNASTHLNQQSNINEPIVQPTTLAVDPNKLLYESPESKLSRLNTFVEQLKLCIQSAQTRTGEDENDHAIEHIYQVGNQQRLFVDYRPDDTSYLSSSHSTHHTGSFATQTFHGKLYIDEVFVCAGQGSNKKFCKRHCFQQAFNRLLYENFDVKLILGKNGREQYELVTTNAPLTTEQNEEFGTQDDCIERESFDIPSTHPMANSKINFVYARDTSTIAERTARQQNRLEQQYWQQWGRGFPMQKPRRTQRSLSPPPPVPHQIVTETTAVIEAAPTTATGVAAIVAEMEHAVKEQDATNDQFIYSFPARPGGDQEDNSSTMAKPDQPICSEAAKAAVDSATQTQQRAKLCKMQPFLFSLLNTLADASHSIDLISTQINKYHLHADFECADRPTSQGFRGYLIVEQVAIANGFGITKKVAKKQAYSNALKSISTAKSFSLELRNQIQWTLVCHLDETGMIKIPLPRRPMALRGEERSSRWGPPTTVSAVTSSTTSAVRHLHERRVEEGSQREKEFQTVGGVCIPPPTLIEPPLTRATIGQDLAKCTSSTDEAIVNNIRRLIPNTFVVFELLDFDENIPGHYVSMLFTSMSKNKLELKFECVHVPTGFMITYTINDRFFMSWVASTKVGAKQSGAKKAIELLKTLYPSIKTKHVVGDTFMNGNEITGPNVRRPVGKIISRSQLYEQPQSPMISAPVSNANGQPKEDMGAKLLKKMGWVGGGIGKDLQGIAEPIQVEDLQGRKGLGSNSLFPSQIFVKNLRRVLEEFIAMNDDDGELQFANEFNSEERKTIHKEAMKLHLTSNSYGRDGERRIRITQKRNVDQLVDHLLTHGGETSRYKLKAQTQPRTAPPKSSTRRDPVSASSRHSYARMAPPPSQWIAPDACDDENL